MPPDINMTPAKKCCQRFKPCRAFSVIQDPKEERKLSGVRLDLVPAWAFLLGL